MIIPCHVQIARNNLNEALNIKPTKLQNSVAAKFYATAAQEAFDYGYSKSLSFNNKSDCLHSDFFDQFNDDLDDVVDTLSQEMGINEEKSSLMKKNMVGWAWSALFDGMQGAIVKTTEHLNELMSHTDINKIPGNFLTPPFPAMYFQFNKPLNFPIEECREYNIIGVYVLSNKLENNLDIAIRMVNMKENNTLSLFLYETLTINTQSSENAITLSNTENSIRKVITDLDKVFNSVYEFVFKTVLYMGLKEARITSINDRKNLEARINKVKSKKATKLENRLSHKYDYILVGNEHPKSDSYAKDDGKNKAVHWRRGHLRNQRFGQNLEQSHIVWIKPMLINKDMVTLPDTVKPKKYVIGKDNGI